jgi:hypothetical protein
MTPRDLLDAEARYRHELDEPLEELLSRSNRRAALPNLVAWLLVVGGGFLLCLLVLVVVSGG